MTNSDDECSQTDKEPPSTHPIGRDSHATIQSIIPLAFSAGFPLPRNGTSAPKIDARIDAAPKNGQSKNNGKSVGTNGRAVPHRPTSRTRAFRRRFFPDATDRQWNDWRWQVAASDSHAGTVRADAAAVGDERDALVRGGTMLPVGVTPYYMSLLDADDPHQPLRRTVIPTSGEFVRTLGEADDPLGEDGHSPGARSGPSLSGPRAVAAARLLLDLLPLLHAVASRRSRRDRAQRKAIGSDLSLPGGCDARPRRPDLRRRSAGVERRQAGLDSRPICGRSRTSSLCGSAPRCRPSCRSGSRATWFACCGSTIRCG